MITDLLFQLWKNSLPSQDLTKRRMTKKEIKNTSVKREASETAGVVMSNFFPPLRFSATSFL
jgi:hypothetical protein